LNLKWNRNNPKETGKEKEKKGPSGPKRVPATLTLADPGPHLSRLADPGPKGGPFCPALAVPVGKPGQKAFPNRDKFSVL